MCIRDRNTGIADDDGKRCTFYFNTSGSNKGAGFSGEKDGFLYYNGLLVTADGDSQYEVYQVDGRYYLVNESGKVQTNKKAYKMCIRDRDSLLWMYPQLPLLRRKKSAGW